MLAAMLTNSLPGMPAGLRAPESVEATMSSKSALESRGFVLSSVIPSHPPSVRLLLILLLRLETAPQTQCADTCKHPRIGHSVITAIKNSRQSIITQSSLARDSNGQLHHAAVLKDLG